MKLTIIAALIALALSGCATPVNQQSGDPVGPSPTTAEEHDTDATAPPRPPRATKPPVIVSRIEPSIAASNVLSQAVAARQSGHLEQALLLLDRAQRMSPQAGEVYLEMARVKRQIGQLSKAEQLCLKAMSLSGPDQRFRNQVMQELDSIRKAQRATANTG